MKNYYNIILSLTIISLVSVVLCDDTYGDGFDEDSFIEEVIGSDGRGHSLSSYDGDENEIVFNDEWYYIYRTN